MIRWKTLYAKPAGSLPGGTVTQWGAAIFTILLAVLIFSWAYLGGGEDETETPAGGQEQTAGGSFDNQMASRVREENERQRQQRMAKARSGLNQQQDNLRRGIIGGQLTAMDGLHAQTPGGGAVTGGAPATEAEWELREALRLEDIERRRRSIRSQPVAQSYRAARAERAPAAEAGSDTADQTASRTKGDALEAADATRRTLASLQQSLDELQAEAAAEMTPPAVPALGAGPPATTEARSPADPVIVSKPSDPAGWERIYEGSFLEAVLVTELTGDFPGPVLAMVSLPFYSSDRQHILVPRGARVLGTAQAVTNQDQSRLAVSFHRLLWPDGRWVSLEFHGLNQVGEAALKDRVNRHYISMFSAVGAIGVLSGLTLQGSNPYAGGGQGFRAGAGQGLGQSATQILQRFLNRLPTITIRAGHRLRVWFTSDVLVPRPKGD